MDRLLARMESAGRELVITREELQAWVDEFAEEGASMPPLRSAAVHLQLAARDADTLAHGDYLAVLNDTLPGCGRFFTRYCELLPEAGWDREINAQLQQLQAGAPVLELQSVLAHNAQVHPPLTERMRVRAGERSDRPMALDAKDITLPHDAATDELRDLHRGEPVIPMYMGFFHALALPMTHRERVDGVTFTYHTERNRPLDYREGLLHLCVNRLGVSIIDEIRHAPPTAHVARHRLAANECAGVRAALDQTLCHWRTAHVRH